MVFAEVAMFGPYHINHINLVIFAMLAMQVVLIRLRCQVMDLLESLCRIIAFLVFC